jgi:hypothetical protein
MRERDDDCGAAPPGGTVWRGDMAVQVLLPFHKAQLGDGDMDVGHHGSRQ